MRTFMPLSVELRPSGGFFPELPIHRRISHQHDSWLLSAAPLFVDAPFAVLLRQLGEDGVQNQQHEDVASKRNLGRNAGEKHQQTRHQEQAHGGPGQVINEIHSPDAQDFGWPVDAFIDLEHYIKTASSTTTDTAAKISAPTQEPADLRVSGSPLDILENT